MAGLSPFVSFGLVLVFQAWLWPFLPVFGLSDTLYNLTIAKKMSFLFIHRTVNMVYKRVCSRKKQRKSNSWLRGHRNIV